MTDTSPASTTDSAAQPPPPTVWPSLRYRDGRAGIEFLTKAFGFEAVAVYTADDDDSFIQHAELRWPLGGGIMLGSERESPDWPQHAGHAAAYVVTDDADPLYERALAAGASIVREIRDEHYGSRGFSVRDPEGNLWSFGTYRGEPL
jgi:uncharacterized glyoxalase superfamily protein PhnB